MKKKLSIILIGLFLINISACSTIFRHMKEKRNRNYKEGMSLYKRGKYEDAKDRFETVVSIDPKYGNAKTLLKRSERYLKRKEWKENRKVHKKYLQAKRLKRSRRYDAALTMLLAVDKQESGYRDVGDLIDECRGKLSYKYDRMVKLAKLLQKRRRYKKAYRYCLKAKKYKPISIELPFLMNSIEGELEKKSEKYREKGEEYYDKKRYTRAVRQLKVALRRHPWDKKAKELLVKSNTKIKIDKDYKDGIVQYKRGKYFVALSKFRYVNNNERGYRNTASYIKRIKKKVSKNVGQYYNRGVSYYDREKFKASINEFNKVLMVSPSHKKAIEYKKRAKTKLSMKRSLGG